MLKVSIIQAPLVWENKEENFSYFLSKINSIIYSDLVVLPEMFLTGFSMNPEDNYITMDSNFISELLSVAKAKNIAITGSVIVKENNNYYNRLIFILPDGTQKKYDKKHLFTLAKEEKFYTPGSDKIIVEYKGWKICPLICYDLRFPVYSRNVENYDLLLYVASWPDKRIYAWDSLLKARAIENMAYTIGVNHIGADGYNATYSGHSQILDYMGQYLVQPFDDEQIITVELDKSLRDKAVQKLGFLSDRDNFTIN